MPPLNPTSATSQTMGTSNAAPLPALAVLAVILTIAVYVELKESRIPNWLTFSGMALGLFIGYLNGSQAFFFSVGGLVIGFGFLFIFYVFGGIGGGDVKLMGAAGALMGVKLVGVALVYTAFIGAFLGVMIVVWRKDFWTRLGQGLRRLAFWRKNQELQPLPASPITVPYGLAIAAGCVMTLLVKGTS